MKLYVLLVFCCAVVLGEKKINLEDIERDNLKSEAQSEEDSVGPEETKYNSNKAENNAQYQYRTDTSFIGGQQPQQFKYVIQPEAYTQNVHAYQQQQQYGPALATQQQPPQQYYNAGYQTEAAYPAQKISPQISYQAEIPIGNQIQNYQQKAATQKFSGGIGKASHFTNLAASAANQQLHYSTINSGLNLKNQVQPLLYQLATEAARKIPTYSSAVSQGPKISYQPQPQIQYVYEPQYVQPTETPYAIKNTQKYTYAAPAAQQTYSSPQAYSGLTYSQQSSIHTQPKLAHTQAYYIQPQLTQYYQEPAYASPVQSNSLSYIQSQPLYFPSNLAQQLQTQILEQHGSHSISQNYAKIPEEPRYTLTAPQISAQNFKSEAITQLQPVYSGISHTNNELQYSGSGSKSLLDSYTPSHIIAAQDGERYRERPLHLEGGFLPSKGSYAHSYTSKRKAE